MSEGRKEQVSDGPSFLRLLERESGLYQRLRSLAEKQRKLVAGGDAEGLLEVLAARQKVVAELGRVSGQMGSLQDRWEEIKASLSPAEQERAEGLLKGIREALSWIMAADEADSEALRAQQREVSQSMASLQSGRQAVAAYAPAGGAAAGSRFMDQTDEA